ncbi:MAG: hypothetical protein LBH59_08080 [Planctomycetaceae bacterium]|jgi:hypothetical protein|nr:hypothetical protein [Planctomycetaceae bacterium]
MKRNNYWSKIFVCCLLFVVFGCGQTQPPKPSAESQQEYAQMLINQYVDEVKKNAASKPVEIDVEAEVLEVLSSPESEHNLRFAILIRKLIDVWRIDDAVKILDKITDPIIKDTYCSEIVRIQINHLKNLKTNNTSLPSSDVNIPASSVKLQAIADVIYKVNDLLLLTELSIELATVNSEDSDKLEIFDLLTKTADKVYSSKTSGIRQVKSLQRIADCFLKQEQKERALELCQKSEERISTIDSSFDCVVALLDLSALYMLLDSISEAGRLCDASIPHAAKITIPAEKATAILKIAETSSILQIKFRSKRDTSKLAQLKKLILAVDPIIASNDAETGNTTPKQSENLQNNSTIFSWERIRMMRDVLLRGLVRHQVWLVPESQISLDEIWSTIHDIEDDSLRDDAIISAIDMFCITGLLEDAQEWATFIKNTGKKNESIKKINARTETLKKPIE